MRAMTNIAMFAITSALMAGVSGPGPNEYVKLDVEGYRDRISIQSVPTGCQGATSVPVVSGVAISDARAVAWAFFPGGSGNASAAAASGMNARMTSVRSIPMRSPSMPTNGALSPPVPHAKPIINDDTVAAL